MTTHLTDQPTTGQMRFALDLVRWYSIHFPELPAAYVTVLAHRSHTELGIQTSSQAAFEMWREALEFDSERTELVHTKDSSWLQLNQTASRFQVQVHLTCHEVPHVAPRPVDVEQVAA
ncbi:hypothetical protein [Streptomyces sp. NPDC001781]